MASKESIADPAADCTSNEPAVALQSSLPEPGQANSSGNYPSLTFLMLLHIMLMDPPLVTDMPIARRNSLNRFLGKRKDRSVLLPRNFPLLPHDCVLILSSELLGWAMHHIKSMVDQQGRRRQSQRRTSHGSAWVLNQKAVLRVADSLRSRRWFVGTVPLHPAWLRPRHAWGCASSPPIVSYDAAIC